MCHAFVQLACEVAKIPANKARAEKPATDEEPSTVLRAAESPMSDAWRDNDIE